MAMKEEATYRRILVSRTEVTSYNEVLGSRNIHDSPI